MHRIIAGTLYERNPTPYAHNIRIHDLGNGHVEALATPRYDWREVGPVQEHALADWQAYEPDFFGRATNPPPPTATELLDRAAANTERSCRRATTQVRRLAKWKTLTEMITLTYRDNVQDREKMARDFDVFAKRMNRILPRKPDGSPGFDYVCVFEKQKRGAYHAHIAVKRVLSHYVHKGQLVRSYDLIRSVWRAVVGKDAEGNWNGNIDVSRGKAVRRCTAKLASYLSKYIGKDFGAGEKNKNSYQASGRKLPDAIKLVCPSPYLADAISDLVGVLHPEATGRATWSHCMLSSGGWFLCLSPPVAKPG